MSRLVVLDTYAITVRQPWASLIAVGAKTIETRSWATKYRGPLLIHAGLSESHLGRRSTRTEQRLTAIGDYTVERDLSGLLLRGPIAWPYRLPLGAVVAVADLVDCFPVEKFEIDGMGNLACQDADAHLCVDGSTMVLVDPEDTKAPRRFDAQVPYGDFTRGRWAWMLDNVRRIDAVPAKGKQGLWKPDADLIAAVNAQLAVTA